MYSIQQRITRNILICVVSGSVIATIILSSLINRYLRQEFDDSLLQKARTLITLTTQRNGEIELDFAGEFMPEYEREKDAEYFQLWFADGRLIERSDSLTLGALERDLPKDLVQTGSTFYSDITLPDGRQGRLVTIQFVPQLFDENDFEASTPDDDLIPDIHGGVQDTSEIDPTSGNPISSTQALFSVAREFESTNETIWASMATLIIIFSIMTLVVYVLCRRAVRKGLNPLHSISDAIGKVDAKKLAASSKVSTQTQELQLITTRFNSLIDRVQAEFDNHKRFTGDVAHELRTPISELRLLSEVAEKWPEDQSSNERFFQDAKEIAESMSKIVVDLLELIRSDSGNFHFITEGIDLCELLEGLVTKAKVIDPGLKIKLTMPDKHILKIFSDRQKLTQVFQNLVTNAVTYRTKDSPIHIAVIEDKNTLKVTVTNQVENLVDEDLDVMFKRFWRKDSSRTGSGNSGLGLSIVDEICTQLDVDISSGLSEGILSITIGGLSKSA